MSNRSGILDRGWDLHVLERVPVRKLLLLNVAMWFALGLDLGINIHQGLGFQQLDMSEIPWFVVYALLVFRYTRLTFQRLRQ